ARGSVRKERWAILEQLANERLVTITTTERGDASAELVHEALITRWPRFAAWVDADREYQQWRERLQPFVLMWKETGRDADYLLHGRERVLADDWLSRRREDLGPDEVEFIRRSIKAYDAEQQAAQDEAIRQVEWQRKRTVAWLRIVAAIAAVA